MLCQICNSTLQFPYMFECGHSTTCSQCFVKTFANVKKRKRSTQYLFCVVCQKKVSGNAKLIVNYTLHDVLNQNNKHSTNATLLTDMCEAAGMEPGDVTSMVNRTVQYMENNNMDNIARLERCGCGLPALPRTAVSGKVYVGCPRFSFAQDDKCKYFRWVAPSESKRLVLT